MNGLIMATCDLVVCLLEVRNLWGTLQCSDMLWVARGCRGKTDGRFYLAFYVLASIRWRYSSKNIDERKLSSAHDCDGRAQK